MAMLVVCRCGGGHFARNELGFHSFGGLSCSGASQASIKF